jgi:hypothetical protein
MHSIATACGYDSVKLLLTSEATSANVFKAISQAADVLVAGDIFLYTYSGHGGQIPDANGDENDQLDETWCLYDRMMVDDEIYRMLGLFKEGVRILVISDSCHSGTVVRFNLGNFSPVTENGETIEFRIVPPDILDSVYSSNQNLYDAIQWSTPRDTVESVRASVILISGCLDNQLSADGFNNGRFTSRLLTVWNNGVFQGTYESFWKTILSAMPRDQSPNFYTVGPRNVEHERMKPFVITDMNSRALEKSSRSGVCYYNDKAYSEGSEVDMGGQIKRCMSDGTWS